MSLQTNVDWVKEHLEDLAGKDVLEVGSRNCPFPGTEAMEPVVTDYVLSLKPASFTGIDVKEGPHVTRILPVEKLAETVGFWKYDVVLCLEVIEHIQDWQLALENMFAVLRPGGCIYLTTRTEGFPYHGYPDDFWRFPEWLFRHAFAALHEIQIELSNDNGIYVKARKPYYKAREVPRG
jgi:SAM-dependent methyltransferase